MRRLLIIVPIALVLIVGVLLATVLMNVDRYRPRVQAELQKKLNRPVTLGALSLRLLPLSLTIDGLTIGESSAFSSTHPFATAKDVSVSAGLLSLIEGNPEVKSLKLAHPQIELIRNAQGVWNFSTLGGQSSSSGGNSQLTLDELKIDDGQIALTDATAHPARSVYDHIDVDLTDFAPKKRFGLKLGAHLPGEGKELITFDGNVGPLLPGNTAAVPVSGRVSVQEVSLAAINRFTSGAVPPNTDAVTSGDANVTSENEAISCKGNLKLVNAVIRGNKLAYPVEAQYDLTADRKQDKIQVRSGVIKLGPTSFSVSGDVDAGMKPANLNVRLTTNGSSITELAQLAGSFGVAFNPAYQVTGNVTADITAKGAATAPQLNGTMDAKHLEISGGEIKAPVLVPEVALALSPDVIRSNSFEARSGATTLAVAFALSRYTTHDSNVDATIKTNGANIAELLNMAKAYGMDASKGMAGTGKLSLDAHVQGPTSQPSKLVYSGTGSVSGATLTTPSLTKPVSISSANLRFSQNSAAVDNLAASVANTNLHGSFSASNFAAPQVQFALTADKIDTAELQQLSAKPQPASTAAQAKAPLRSNEPSLLDKVTGSGTLAANTVKAQDLVLNNVHATCKLDHGVIQLSPLTADLFGGKESGAVNLDTRPAHALCSVNSKLSGVDTNAMLSAVSSVKNTLYGSLAANANLSFTLESGPDLARTLNGTLTFNVANGQLKNVNILNEVSKVGKFLGSAPSQGGSDTALKQLGGTFNIHDGVAATNNLTAALSAGSLAGTGTLNLVSQAIDMRMSAVLASGPSQSVGGSHVGGYMTTALANNKGELVIPVLVTGTMAHPTFTPDLQAMAKMKLSNLLPTAADPSKLAGSVLGNKGVGGVLGGLLGRQQAAQPAGQPAANAAQQKPQDSINSLLQQFGKKKPAPKQ